MTKKNKKRIEMADYLLSFNIYDGSKFVYGILFSFLFYLAFVGIMEKQYNGYFEVMVFFFILIFCFREADRYFSALNGLFLIPGFGILLNYLLLGMGKNFYFIHNLIQITIILIIISLLYELFFRRYIIDKIKLTKKERFDLLYRY